MGWIIFSQWTNHLKVRPYDHSLLFFCLYYPKTLLFSFPASSVILPVSFNCDSNSRALSRLLHKKKTMTSYFDRLQNEIEPLIILLLPVDMLRYRWWVWVKQIHRHSLHKTHPQLHTWLKRAYNKCRHSVQARPHMDSSPIQTRAAYGHLPSHAQEAGCLAALRVEEVDFQMLDGLINIAMESWASQLIPLSTCLSWPNKQLNMWWSLNISIYT